VGPKGPGLIKKYPAVAVFYEIRGPKGPEKENVCPKKYSAERPFEI
jgi:hypothetical protein